MHQTSSKQHQVCGSDRYDVETIDSWKPDKGTSLVFIYFGKANFINIKALFIKLQDS